MIELLHSFGCGIAFVAGALLGFGLYSLASRQARQELAEHLNAHKDRIEDRLFESMLAHRRIASALEVMTEQSNAKNSLPTEPAK